MKILVNELIVNGLIKDLTNKKIEIDIKEDVEYSEYFGYKTVVEIDTALLSPIIKDIPIKLPLRMFVIRTDDGTFSFSKKGWKRV